MLVIIAIIGAFLLGIACGLGRQPDQQRGGRPQAPATSAPFSIRLSARSLTRAAHEVLTAYLLVRVGIVGGSEVAAVGLRALIGPGSLALALSLGLCSLTLIFLAGTTRFSRETRVTLATHFGSVSIGTFAACQAFLEASGVPFHAVSGIWVAVMEMPAVFVGVLLLGQSMTSFWRLLYQHPALLLLPLSCLVGAVLGPRFLSAPVLTLAFQTAFTPLLCVFLAAMGLRAGTHLRRQRAQLPSLIGFGVVMPMIGGTVGAGAARLIGLNLGDAATLATLAASASYVAAPVGMQAALKSLSPSRAKQMDAALAAGLTVAVGITLPFNILIGLHMYLWEARAFQSPAVAGTACLGMILTTLLVARWGRILCSSALRALRPAVAFHSSAEPTLHSLQRLPVSPSRLSSRSPAVYVVARASRQGRLSTDPKR